MNANDAQLTEQITAPTEDMGPGHRAQSPVRCASTQMMAYSSRGGNEPVRIRAARVSELPFLQAVDRAAGRMFGDVGMPDVADHHWWPLPVLAHRQDAGRLWVAADETDEPVAFLMADLVDSCMHVEQVSVRPASARRGLGRSLLDHAASLAAADGLPALTLTTFAHVPWNAPYYVRCGFRVLGDAELTPGLRAIRQREAALGLDHQPRVCMRRDL
jgi:GNAT superfamily N-acetyltransferase